MKTGRMIAGIIITAIGGLLMLVSMIFGIIHVAGNLYRDTITLDVDLHRPQTELKTAPFSIAENQKISVWLKYPDRRLENKDFSIKAAFIIDNEPVPVELGQNFNFGYSRNSCGRGQYYRLGVYRFAKPFSGHLSYRTSGSCLPAVNGQIILRESLPFPWPLESIAGFICGLLVMLTGIIILAVKTGNRVDITTIP